MTQCIYCQSHGPFSREHALPRCLGEFRGFPTLNNRVCKKCNNFIGKVEEQFCRSGPEAFFREFLGITGRPSHRKVNSFERGSAGAKPIDFEGVHSEFKIPVLLGLRPNSIGEVLRQIVIKDEGGWHSIRVEEWMKEPAHLQQAMANRKFNNISEIQVFASPEEKSCIEDLVEGAFGGKVNWRSGNQQATVTDPTATFIVTDSYFRAIAKCGFHYFLTTVSGIHGSENPFALLREFITVGGDPDKFVTQEQTPLIVFPTPSIAYPGAHCRPKWYGHVIVTEWQNGNIQCRIQFFLGPHHKDPPVFRVKIAEGADCLNGTGWEGHHFSYFCEGKQGRYHGEVSEVIGPRHER
jgi:RNA polymerase subunit RPABC4/transcription elongation factor Spt4